MKILPSLILSFTLIGYWSCSDSGEPIIEGCMNDSACNYNSAATVDDGNCLENDCADECGGSAIDDECGVCDGSGPIDSNHDCDGGCIVETDICGTCGGTIASLEDCCPEGQVPDCDGECGGSAVADCSGECGGSASKDCADVCGGSAVEDECGQCDGDNSSCVNYSTEIQPIFTTNCTGCHGNSGGLNLGSYSTLMSGGSSGTVVISGNSSESRLIQKLKGTASGSQMPASGCCLDASVIQLIETWIDEGALDN